MTAERSQTPLLLSALGLYHEPQFPANQETPKQALPEQNTYDPSTLNSSHGGLPTQSLMNRKRRMPKSSYIPQKEKRFSHPQFQTSWIEDSKEPDSIPSSSVRPPPVKPPIDFPSRVTVIGFPLDDIQGIMNQFRVFGRFVTGYVEHNALHIEYESPISAQRAILEDGKWWQPSNNHVGFCLLSVKYTSYLKHNPSREPLAAEQRIDPDDQRLFDPNQTDELIQRDTSFFSFASQIFTGW